MKEVNWNDEIPKAEFVFAREFMAMKHNYLCAVCKKDSAVQECHTGVLQPCWECQKQGYMVTQLSWIQRLFATKRQKEILDRPRVGKYL